MEYADFRRRVLETIANADANGDVERAQLTLEGLLEQVRLQPEPETLLECIPSPALVVKLNV